MKIRWAVALLSFVVVWAVSGDRVAVAAPSAPTPVAPAAGANVLVPFTISWSAVSDPSGIAGYNWQVSPSSSFATVVRQDSTGPSVTQDVVSGLVNGTYFWRVQAVNGAGQQGAWSTARSLTVTGAGAGTPGTPALGPTRGYSTFHPWESVHFDWSAAAGAATYRLEVSNDASFPVGTTPPGTVTFWFDNISTTSYEYVHTIEGNWFARVFAVSANNPQDGIRSLPSNVIGFSCFFDNPIGPPPALVSPVNNPTLTLPVTLTWAHVPNPQASGYILEIAKDSAFATIEFSFNQYTDPSAVMLSLTSGSKFWRVRSQQGLASPTTNALTAWSATGRFTIGSALATPVSIAPQGNPAMVVYSGASAMVAVQLTAGVPASGATVALSSSNPSLAPLPATISMPGTQAWAQFPITFGQVTAPTAVTLTATLNGVSASSSVTLRPPTLDDEIFQPGPVLATGGAAMTGWVALEGGGVAGPAGFTASLSTDSPAATVPSTVTIPAGVSGTSFPIQTSSVTATTVVTITASAGGVATRWPITLTPSPAPTSFVVRPMSTVSGSQGIVTAAEGVGHDQLMQVSSSDPALAQVPDFVSVAAGSGVGFFNITNAPVTAPTTVTIRVSGGGVTLSQPLTLYPSLPQLTALTVNPTSVVGGRSATGTVTLASPAPAAGVAVNLGSNLPLAATVPPSVTVPGGATSATFTVTTLPHDTTTVQLSAALDSVFQFASITVNPPPIGPSLSGVSVSPTSVVGGSSATGTVTLSAAAPSGGAAVSLSDNSSATTVPTSVTVPAGATSATFTVRTLSVTSSTTATITASYGGVTSNASLAVTAAAGPPAAPSLLSPASGASFPSGQAITFDWGNVTGASSYAIQIDDSSAFSAPLVRTATVTASQYTDATLPAGTLWWRVRATNSTGTFGAWSAVRTVTVTTTGGGPLPAPSLLSPASDARFSPGQTIAFDWSDVAGATTYTIQIDDSDKFDAPLVVSQSVGASQYSTALGTRKDYWWRVRAVNASGSPGAWSGVRRFRVD